MNRFCVAILRGLAGLLVTVFFSVAVEAESVETKLLPSDGALGDRFGSGVALAGDYAFIGAQADDDLGGDAGAAYIYNAAGATQLLKIHASDGAGGDYFGVEVAASGNLAIAGALRDDHVATDAGSAYIFSFPEGIELHKLVADDAAQDDQFGNDVAISASYALVGAPKEDQSTSIYDSGAAYLFDTTSGAQLRKLTASDLGRQDGFGYAVAVSEQYAVIGAPFWDGIGRTDCGAVYVYDVATGAELWLLTAAEQGAYERFGNAVALEDDLLLIGEYWDSNAAGDDAGTAYLFDLATGNQIRQFLPSEPQGGGDWFGVDVALADGYAVIGACQQGYGTELEGFACFFNVSSGEEVATVTASDGALDDNFGGAVAIHANRALIAADMNDDYGVNSGSAYLFEPVSDPSIVAYGFEDSGPALRNVPNPFAPQTEIRFILPRSESVSLAIFDAGGRLVRTLLTNEACSAGETRIAWDGTGADGGVVPAGVYFYRLTAGGMRSEGRTARLE